MKFTEEKLEKNEMTISPFASTLPKPHALTLQPKLCQRASKACSLKEIVLYPLWLITKEHYGKNYPDKD